MRRIAALLLVVVLTGCTPAEKARWLPLFEWWNRPTATPVPCQQWVGASRAAGIPEDLLPTIHYIMNRESRCAPWAIGPTRDAGLMQVHWPTWLDDLCRARIACTVQDLLNPGTNMRGAEYILDHQGLTAWNKTRPR